MFSNKFEVDRYVKETFNKLSTDSERDAKCYMLAKHYYKVKDYESAIKYLNRYILNVRNTADSQKFLGECYEAIKQPTKALQAYKSSLELDGGQRELVLKVCELLSDPELPLVTSVASYWLERLYGLYPKHPSVFKLRERILRANPQSHKDPRELESLILSEIMARPNVPEVRIRFFDFLLESDKVTTAIKQAAELVPLDMFPDHLPWFECLSRVNQAYEKEFNGELTMDYLLMKLTVLERRCYLSLQDFGPDRRSNVECALTLFSLDQGLHSVSKFQPKPTDKIFFNLVLSHFRAQLASHLAVYRLRRAKSESGSWQRAVKVASPLLAMATKRTEITDRQETKLMAQWRIQAAERVSVSAHVLRAWAGGNPRFLEEVYKSCGGKWRERTYENIFHNKEYHDASNASEFINNSSFLDLPSSLPSTEELEAIDKDAQLAHPLSLHHMVWLGLANSVSLNHIKPSFRCQLFPNMQLTVTNLENTSPDTMSRLDVDTFFFAAVFCAKKDTELCPDGERPKLLPVIITEELCNHHQAEWWLLINKLYSKSTINCDQRLRLRKGLETVRLLGMHGLHPKLLYHIAQQFRLLFEQYEETELRDALCERAEMLWTGAVLLLEKMKKRQAIRENGSKLFDYRVTDWPLKDIDAALEEGKTFLAMQLFTAENYEEALHNLSDLKNPDALYYQALIYKILAEAPNTIKSEAVRLLNKARDVLGEAAVAMRKRGPSQLTNLKQLMDKTSDEIESLLAQMDFEPNGIGPHFTQKSNQRLDSVLRQSLTHHSTPKLVRSPVTVENLHQTVNHNHDFQNNASNSDAVTEELKLLRSDIGDIKSLLQESLAEFKKIAYKLIERQEMDDILNAEDFGNEEVYDQVSDYHYSIPETNALRSNPPVISQFPTVFGKPFTPGTIWPVSLPFSEGQQLPDFRALQNGPPPAVHPWIQPSMAGLAAPGISTQISDMVKIVPNVVVTSSATLPTYTKCPQPAMAVTIPIEHLRGNYPACNYPTTVESPSDKYQARAYEQPLHIQSTPPKLALNNTLSSENKSGAFATPELPQSVSADRNQRFQSEQRGNIFETDAELCLNHHSPTPNWITGKLLLIVPENQTRARVVMRPADGQQVIDVQLTPTMILSRQSDTVVSWSVPDYGYGDSVVQKFVVRFKAVDISRDFEYLFKQYREQSIVPPQIRNQLDKTPVTAAGILQGKSIIAPPTFNLASKELTTTASSFLTPTKTKDGLESTEKTVFGTKIDSGFNFSSLAQTAQVSNAFAPSTEFKGFAGMGKPLFASNAGKNASQSVDQDASCEEDKEYEPNIEFTPVIPLPDLVEIKTGEEEEKKIYEERAKILKFTSDTKEWKEKGRGNVKLLQNPDTGKIRIIMRRDQVLKVCCNHYLDENMKFQIMASSNRAATWSAQDFSGGELSPELLAIQFSTPEILNQFLEKIEELQQKMTNGCIMEKSSKKKVVTKNEPVKPLSEMFKKAPGSWECDLCLVRNKADVYKCVACETKRPGDFGPAAESKPQEKSSFTFGIPASTPTKTAITFGVSAPGTDEPKSSPFSFSGTPTTGFSFGTTPTKSFSFGVNTPTNDAGTDYKIGSSNKFTFKFNKSLKEDEVKSPVEDEDDKSEDELHDIEHEDESLTFNPVVPLPDKVPLHTGEEDEAVIFSHRAKLFRYSDKEWKERGLGELKVLKHNDTKKARLLMRREQVFKICLNHYLTKDIEFTAKDCKSWIWTAADYADGAVTNELFCIRFRDEEIAGKFKEAVDIELTNIQASPTAVQKVTAQPADPPSAIRTLFKSDEVQQLYKYEASAEDQAEAKRLQLPVNFYRYKVLKPCTGCIGCEDDDDESTSKPEKNLQTPETKVTADTVRGQPATTAAPSGLLPTPTKASLPSTPMGQIPKPETIFSQMASEESPKKPAPEEKPKSSVFENFSFKSALDAPAKVGGPTPVFGSATGSIFGNKALTNFSQVPIFGGSAVSGESVSSIFGGKKSLDDTTKPAFTADSNLSFASLSQNQTAFATGNTPTWNKTISPMFSNQQQKKKEPKSDSESDGSNDDNPQDNYDPQYKPVINLPDTIEVRTGEEDEKKLFSERAKLYRYDKTTKEWKERGVGEIKVLTNVENGTYRILMRREFVHKIVCNMRITPALQLQPMQKSTNACVWFGPNFIDDSSENEQLAVKFKFEESLNKFKQTVNDCLEELANASRELTNEEYYSGEGHSEYEDDDDDDDEDEEEEEESIGDEMTWVKTGASLETVDVPDGMETIRFTDGTFKIFENRTHLVKIVINTDSELCAEFYLSLHLDGLTRASSSSFIIDSSLDRCKYHVSFSDENDADDTFQYLNSLVTAERQKFDPTVRDNMKSY